MFIDGMLMLERTTIERHLDELDLALLRAEIEFGNILEKEKLLEFWHHVDNCELCRQRLLEKKKQNSLTLIQTLSNFFRKSLETFSYFL